MLRCMAIGACAVLFLHYIPLYRNTKHYATLKCNVKTSLRADAHKNILHFSAAYLFFTLARRIHLLSLVIK